MNYRRTTTEVANRVAETRTTTIVVRGEGMRTTINALGEGMRTTLIAIEDHDEATGTMIADEVPVTTMMTMTGRGVAEMKTTKTIVVGVAEMKTTTTVRDAKKRMPERWKGK